MLELAYMSVSSFSFVISHTYIAVVASITDAVLLYM